MFSDLFHKSHQIPHPSGPLNYHSISIFLHNDDGRFHDGKVCQGDRVADPAALSVSA